MHPNVRTMVDDEDFDRLIEHRWAATRRKKKLYVRAVIGETDFLLNRFIMQPPEDKFVGYRDGNPLNNQKSNLWICTKEELHQFATEVGSYRHLEAEHIHRVRRKLSDGTVKIYLYNRLTKEPLGNKIVNR
jgi:hypothetical protein